MSADRTGLDASRDDIEARDTSPGALASLFGPRTRIDVEPGVWSLLLVPVLVCVAMVIFVALAPGG